jgi:6,7-dimethyl-8-ribityllumazine synthase
MPPTEIRGSEAAGGCRFAIVASRFNDAITSGLLDGARQALSDAGVSDTNVVLVRVPGAFELPAAALRLAQTGRFDAIICLGCLIKGDTMHFEYIAEAASHGIMHVSVTTGVPVAFGVLTAMTDEQAIERSKPGGGNKGREAALAAVEMAALFRQLNGTGTGDTA